MRGGMDRYSRAQEDSITNTAMTAKTMKMQRARGEGVEIMGKVHEMVYESILVFHSSLANAFFPYNVQCTSTDSF